MIIEAIHYFVVKTSRHSTCQAHQVILYTYSDLLRSSSSRLYKQKQITESIPAKCLLLMCQNIEIVWAMKLFNRQKSPFGGAWVSYEVLVTLHPLTTNNTFSCMSAVVSKAYAIVPIVVAPTLFPLQITLVRLSWSLSSIATRSTSRTLE